MIGPPRPLATTAPPDGAGPYGSRCRACGQPLGGWATDRLTGLLDRWGWDDEAPRALAHAQQRGEPTALIIVDLDHFKGVNDRFGHLAGDAVLQQVAVVLRTATRRDDLLGRYGGHGGDEFLALLPATDLPAAVAVARRVQAGIRAMRTAARTIAGPVVITGCTASIGVAAHDAGRTASLPDLLLEADGALRLAKLAGRDQTRTAVTSRPSGTRAVSGPPACAD
nr:GGDEF domain-containing protein [Planosporangium thailandense]